VRFALKEAQLVPEAPSGPALVTLLAVVTQLAAVTLSAADWRLVAESPSAVVLMS